jgi:mRNA interferase RelE/StbE
VYRIEVSPAADRDIEKLKERINQMDFKRLRTAVGNLAKEPRSLGVRKIKGAERAYRVRVGSYRIIYEIYDSDHLVLILKISRRNETTYRS